MHPELRKAYDAVRAASHDLNQVPESCRAAALERYNALVLELPKIAARVNESPSPVSTTNSPSASCH